MNGAPASAKERGLTPFAVFGVAIVVAAAWALYMGFAFDSTPTFVSDALPTIVGVAVAVVAMLVIAAWAPKNE